MKKILFLSMICAAAGSFAATWTAGGGADTSILNSNNWDTAFNYTGSEGGTNYVGFNNWHADVNGDYDLTLSNGWFRMLSPYQFRMYNENNTLTIGTGAHLSSPAVFSVQGGTVIQNDGQLDGGSWAMSQGSATSSSYTLNDGSMSFTGPLTMQPTGTDVSTVFTQNGGTVTVGGDINLQARNSGDSATLNLNGGTMTVAGIMYHRENAAFVGTHNVNINSNATLVLNGGTAQVTGNTGSSNLVFNLNGGTLATKPTASAPVFGSTQTFTVNADSVFELQNGASQSVTFVPTLVVDGADLNFKNSDPDNLLVFAGGAWNGTGSLSFEGANDVNARFQFQGGGNTFSGGVTINSGYVRLNAGTTYGTEVTAGGLGTGTIAFGNQGDSTLLLNYTSGDAQNGIQVDAGSATNTVLVPSARSANFSFAFGGGINLDGDLTIDNQSSGIMVSGAATGDGNLILNDGIYQSQTTGNTVGGILVKNGAELRHGVDNSLATNVAVTLESGGSWNIGGRNQQAGSIAGAGTINIQGNRNLNFGYDNTDTEFSGSIPLGAGSGAAFGKLGTGTTTLSGDNAFVNHVNVLGGTLKLGHTNALGSTNGFNVVWGGTTLDLNGQTIAGEKVFVRDSGTAGGLINSSTTAAEWTGEVITDHSNVGDASIGGSGDIVLSGAVKTSDPLTLGTNSVVLTKMGAGTVSFDGTLEIDSLVVSAGTVDGSGTVTFDVSDADVDAITVNAGGTLDITTLNADFSVTNTLTQAAYIVADYGSGTLTGSSFASVSNVPSGYALNYAYASGTQIALVQQGGGDPYADWAAGYGLVEGPTGDDDNDGFTNQQEYDADLNPTNAASILAVQSVSIASGTATVSWINGGSNATVYLEYLPDTDSTWTNIYTLAAPASVSNSYDHGNSDASGWYRVKAQRP